MSSSHNTSDGSTSNKVLTYDGHRAVQRPAVVIYDDTQYVVIDCQSLFISTGVESDAPVKRGFHVQCEGGRQFYLTLTEGTGWTIQPIQGPYVEPSR